MADINKLVHDIGFEVDKLLGKVKDEQNKIKDLRGKISHTTNRTAQIEEFNNKLKDEIKRIEDQCFRECSNSTNLTSTNDLLLKREEALHLALSDVQNSNEKIRAERVKIIEEYREKFQNYQQYIERNDLLKSFLDLWKEKNKCNQEIVELPSLITEHIESLPKHLMPSSLLTTLKGVNNIQSTIDTNSEPPVEQNVTDTETLIANQLDDVSLSNVTVTEESSVEMLESPAIIGAGVSKRTADEQIQDSEVGPAKRIRNEEEAEVTSASKNSLESNVDMSIVGLATENSPEPVPSVSIQAEETISAEMDDVNTTLEIMNAPASIVETDNNPCVGLNVSDCMDISVAVQDRAQQPTYPATSDADSIHHVEGNLAAELMAANNCSVVMGTSVVKDNQEASVCVDDDETF